MPDFRIVEHLVVVHTDPDKVLDARILLVERFGDGRQCGPGTDADVPSGMSMRAYPHELVSSCCGSMTASDHLGWHWRRSRRLRVVGHLSDPSQVSQSHGPR